MDPLNAQVEIYAEQIAADGVGIESVQSLILQFPPEDHPHELPAPSVVALHKAKEFKEY